MQLIQGANKDVKAQKDAIKQKSQTLLNDILSSPKQERGEILKKALESGELDQQTMEQFTTDVKSFAKDQTLGTEAKLIMKYPSEARAVYVREKLQSIPKDEREDWLNSMIEVGAINESVLKAIQAQMLSELPVIAQ